MQAGKKIPVCRRKPPIRGTPTWSHTRTLPRPSLILAWNESNTAVSVRSLSTTPCPVPASSFPNMPSNSRIVYSNTSPTSPFRCRAGTPKTESDIGAAPGTGHHGSNQSQHDFGETGYGRPGFNLAPLLGLLLFPKAVAPDVVGCLGNQKCEPMSDDLPCGSPQE